MTKLDQRLNRLETRINNNWDQMDEAARIKARSTMKALRQKRIELAESFGSWKTSSASAWEHMKEGFSEAYQDLQKSWNKAKTEFSSNNE
nr:hypothetical protein [Methylomarinum sp. Ch1-1]MDP4519157.1 hypothetical protein [Methylomarinum sp. Ch1-1]